MTFLKFQVLKKMILNKKMKTFLTLGNPKKRPLRIFSILESPKKKMTMKTFSIWETLKRKMKKKKTKKIQETVS